jgi:hypothetical protein
MNQPNDETNYEIIDGIRCIVAQDELGFWDVTICHQDGEPFGSPQCRPYYEYIIRGRLSREAAIEQAEQVILALRSGELIMHSTEGQILFYPQSFGTRSTSTRRWSEPSGWPIPNSTMTPRLSMRHWPSIWPQAVRAKSGRASEQGQKLARASRSSAGQAGRGRLRAGSRHCGLPLASRSGRARVPT